MTRQGIVTDHHFVPNGESWRLCAYVYPDASGRCNRAQAAHARTTVTNHEPQPYRCPDCVTTGAATCEHGVPA